MVDSPYQLVNRRRIYHYLQCFLYRSQVLRRISQYHLPPNPRSRTVEPQRWLHQSVEEFGFNAKGQNPEILAQFWGGWQEKLPIGPGWSLGSKILNDSASRLKKTTTKDKKMHKDEMSTLSCFWGGKGHQKKNWKGKGPRMFRWNLGNSFQWSLPIRR